MSRTWCLRWVWPSALACALALTGCAVAVSGGAVAAGSSSAAAPGADASPSAARASAPVPGEYSTPVLDSSAVEQLETERCEQARANNQLVLLEFSAPWCADCRRLRELEQEPVLRRELAGFARVTVNIGDFDQHLELLEMFEVDAIAHWTMLEPSDCSEPIEHWPRIASRIVEPASSGAGAELLARWLRNPAR